jgi:hypothetical protein
MLSALIMIMGVIEASLFNCGQVMELVKLRLSTESLDSGLATCLLWFQVYVAAHVIRWNRSVKSGNALPGHSPGVWDRESDDRPPLSEPRVSIISEG